MSLSRFFLHYLPSGTEDSLNAASGLSRGRRRELLEKEPLNLVLRRGKDPLEASAAGGEALRPLTSLAGGRQGLGGWGSTPPITFLLSVLPSPPKAGFLAGSLQETWVCQGPAFWLEDSEDGSLGEAGGTMRWCTARSVGRSPSESLGTASFVLRLKMHCHQAAPTPGSVAQCFP